MGQRLDNAKNLYLRAIRDGDYIDAIETYAGERYTQHSTPVKDGKHGFIEFFAAFVERNPVRDIEIVRAFEDGQYVFLHVLQRLNDGQWEYVTADIFDTDAQAKLIEHWDIIEEVRPPSAGTRSQLDGPTEPTNLASTQVHKQLVEQFLRDVLIPANFDRLPDFVAPNLAQHHPDIADGLEAFQDHAAASSLRYVEAYNVIGCGDLFAALSEREAAGQSEAVIDLFRIEDHKIAEHWNVVEAITPQETWVNTGKF